MMDRDEARRERYEREYRDCYMQAREKIGDFLVRIREARKKALAFGMVETDYEASKHLRDRVYNYYLGVARKTFRRCTMYDCTLGPLVDLQGYEMELKEEVESYDVRVGMAMELEAKGEHYTLRATESAMCLRRLEMRLGEEHTTHEMYTTRAQESF